MTRIVSFLIHLLLPAKNLNLLRQFALIPSCVQLLHSPILRLGWVWVLAVESKVAVGALGILWGLIICTPGSTRFRIQGLTGNERWPTSCGWALKWSRSTEKSGTIFEPSRTILLPLSFVNVLLTAQVELVNVVRRSLHMWIDQSMRKFRPLLCSPASFYEWLVAYQEYLANVRDVVNYGKETLLWAIWCSAMVMMLQN